MRPIAIDRLIQWTLRDELPKGRPVSASTWDVMVSYSRLGARVDVSRGAGDGLGMVPGTPHPDAEIIAHAIAALPAAEQLLAEDCFALLGPYGALDAAAVQRTAERQRYNLQAAMVRGAILSPPEWDIGLPRPEPLRRKSNGQARVHIERDGQLVETAAHPKHGGWAHVITLGPRCLLDWSTPDVLSLLAARAEYALWHRGLTLVREAVAGRLADHVADAPEAPERPWLMPPRARRLHRAGAERRARPLPLKPERPRALPQTSYKPVWRGENPWSKG